MDVLTVSNICKKMGPAQLVTIREAVAKNPVDKVTAETDLFHGKVAALRRQETDLMKREVKHITTLQDDAELRGMGELDEMYKRRRRGIVIYIYAE